MAADEALPHGRSSSRAPRDILTSEHRSFFSSKSSKKPQQKTANDKLVWFSPVHSPLLSPAREKTLQNVKKKVRQSSIFSIQSRAKGSIEAEEPTSPKVSCIGQVRAHKKDKDPFADVNKKKSAHSKPGSMSPARFFASPGSKWGSLFGSRKDSCTSTPSSSGYGDGEVSCFGLPFESRSAFQTDKTSAFLERSLDPFQERGSSDNSYTNKGTHLRTTAADYHLKEQGICAVADGYFGLHTSDEIGTHACASTRVSHSIWQSKGACANVRQHDTKKLITNLEPYEHAGTEKSSHDEDPHHGKPPASKQRLTYEELPSLHCGAATKRNMKISVEVVPETWLWRNGERLRADSTSHLSCVPERSVSTSREDVEKAKQDEVNMPVSPGGNIQVYTRVAEECVDHPIMLVQPQATDSGTIDKHGKSGICIVDAKSIPVCDSGCQPIDADAEKNNEAEHALTTEPNQSHVAALPCYEQPATLKEKGDEFRNSTGSQGGANGAQNGKQQALFQRLQSEVDVEKNWCFEVKPGYPMKKRIGVDLGKENYSIALPQLLEKSLPSLHSKEDGNQFWSIFKSRKSEAFSGQPFSALILVGYDQSTVSKDMGHKDEELLKGILEVGRLSFHGSAKYFQVLSSDAAFNRSRSATSHRRVIRLQRCNSDPCRPSC